MITWKNMDTLTAYTELQAADKVCLACAELGVNLPHRLGSNGGGTSWQIAIFFAEQKIQNLSKRL